MKDIGKKSLCFLLVLVFCAGILPMGLISLPEIKAEAQSPVEDMVYPESYVATTSDGTPRLDVLNYDKQAGTARFSQAAWGITDKEVDRLIKIINKDLREIQGIYRLKTRAYGGKIVEVSADVTSTEAFMYMMFWAQFYNDPVHYVMIRTDATELDLDMKNLFKQKAAVYHSDNLPLPAAKDCTFRIRVSDKLDHHIHSKDWHTKLSGVQNLVYRHSTGFVTYKGDQDVTYRLGDVFRRSSFFNYCDPVNLKVELAASADLWMHDNLQRQYERIDRKGTGHPVTFAGIRGDAHVKFEGTGDTFFRLHSEETNPFEVYSWEHIGNVDVYEPPRMFVLSDGGSLDLRNGTFEVCSRKIDRHPYDGGIVQLDAYVKGRNGSYVVTGDDVGYDSYGSQQKKLYRGGNLTVTNSRLLFHYGDLIQRYKADGWSNSIELLGTDGAAIDGYFDRIKVENTDILCKNGLEKLDYGGGVTYIEGRSGRRPGITLRLGSNLNMDHVNMKDCSLVLRQKSSAVVRNSTINSFGQTDSASSGRSSYLATVFVDESSASFENCRIHAAGARAKAVYIEDGTYSDKLPVGDPRKKKNFVRCDLSSEQDMVIEGSANMFLDSTLHVQKSDKPFTKDFSHYIFYLEDYLLRFTHLSPDGKHVHALINDPDDQSRDALAAFFRNTPKESGLVRNSATKDPLRTQLGGKTFGASELRCDVPMNRDKNLVIPYDDYYTIAVSDRRTADNNPVPNPKPSPLPVGEKWGVLFNEESTYAEERTVPMTHNKTVRLWLGCKSYKSEDYTWDKRVEALVFPRNSGDKDRGKWISLKRDMFDGPENQEVIPVQEGYNRAYGMTLPYVDIPTHAPGTYLLRFRVIHGYSGWEESSPFMLNVVPFEGETPAIQLMADDRSSYDAKQKKFVVDGRNDVKFMLRNNVPAGLLRSHFARYGLYQSGEGAMLSTVDNVLELKYFSHNQHVSFKVDRNMDVPTEYTFRYQLNLNLPRTTIQRGEESYTRCYGAGAGWNLDLPKRAPVAVEYDVLYPNNTSEMLGKSVTVRFLPQKARPPYTDKLKVTDADKPEVVYFADSRYNLFVDKDKNYSFETSPALNVQLKKLRTQDGYFNDVTLQGFKPGIDPASQEIHPEKSVWLIQGRNQNSGMGVTVNANSQHENNGYTQINDLASRIPAKEFEHTEPLDWYFSVRVYNKSSRYSYTYRTKVFSVNQIGDFTNLEAILFVPEIQVPMNWSGNVNTMLSGPTDIPVQVFFDGMPDDTDELKVEWYLRNLNSVARGEKVLTNRVTKNGPYSADYQNGEISFKVPTADLVMAKEGLVDGMDMVEFYPIVTYLRQGIHESVPYNVLLNPSNRPVRLRIASLPVAPIDHVRFTNSRYIARFVDDTGLHDVPESFKDSSHPDYNRTGTFQNPESSDHFWVYVMIEQEKNVTYEVDWLVRDVKEQSGRLTYSDPKAVAHQTSEQFERVENSQGEGRFVGILPTRDGLKEYLVFGYEFKNDRDFVFGPDTLQVQRVTRPNGYEYAVANFAVNAKVKRIDRSAHHPVITDVNTQPYLFHMHQMSWSAYDEATFQPVSLPSPSDTTIGLKTASGGFAALSGSTDSYYAGEAMPLALGINAAQSSYIRSSSITRVTVDWFSTSQAQHGIPHLLCSNEHNPASLRQPSSIFLNRNNALGDYRDPIVDQPYVYAIVRLFEAGTGMEYVFQSRVTAVPNFYKKASRPTYSYLSINEGRTIYVSKEMFAVRPEIGSIRPDEVPDYLHFENTDILDLWFTISKTEGETTFVTFELINNSTDQSVDDVMLVRNHNMAQNGNRVNSRSMSWWQSRGEQVMLLKTTAIGDTDGNVNTVLDQSTPVIRYLPVVLTSVNAYAPTVDREGQPDAYDCVASRMDDYGQHFICNDWISPGTVTFKKHPATNWSADVGRRLIFAQRVIDNQGGVSSTQLIPIVEMVYTDAGYQLAPTPYGTFEHNDACFNMGENTGFAADSQNPFAPNCTMVRADGSVYLTEAFFDAWNRELSNDFVFVAISNIDPINEETLVSACGISTGISFTDRIVEIGAPVIDSQLSKEDYVGKTIMSGIPAEKLPSLTLELPTERYGSKVTYTWYAYDLTKDRLIPVGEANCVAGISMETRNGNKTVLAKMPLSGFLRPEFDGNYELFCRFTYQIQDNGDGGQKVCHGVAGIKTTDSHAPVFNDAEKQTATLLTSFDAPFELDAESYKQKRTEGFYGTFVKAKGPAIAIVPNYLKVAENPSVPRYSDQGIDIKWDWNEGAEGIGKVNISYVVKDGEGNEVYRNSLEDCGKLVTLPVYNKICSYFIIEGTATNYYAPSNTTQSQNFTIQYTVSAAETAWKPVIETIGSFDVQLIKLPELKMEAKLDQTNHDGGTLTYLWEYETAGQRVKISEKSSLNGTDMMAAGINSLGEYQLHLTVTNTCSGMESKASTSFSVNVVPNNLYEIRGALKDKAAASQAVIKLYDGSASDEAIRNGSAAVISAENHLDAEAAAANGDGSYTHSYYYHIANGSYKISYAVSGLNMVIKAFTVQDADLLLDEVILIPPAVSITGTAISKNNLENITYLLYDSTKTDKEIRADWQSGTPANALSYASVNASVSENADGKHFNQAFEFRNVPAGTYKLLIAKEGKYAPKVLTVTVGAETADVGNVKLWLYGDMNDNGIVETKDYLLLLAYTNHSENFEADDPQTKADRLFVMDVNEDGKLNTSDILHCSGYQNHQASAFDSFR